MSYNVEQDGSDSNQATPNNNQLHVNDMSKFFNFFDTFLGYVDGVDMFQVGII